jgi:hypothetical protein
MSAPTSTGTRWITQGFDSFRRGTFGNAGQNLYVSRGGVLQRIHQFDLNSDGWVDVLFCNSQEHLESPPAYVYLHPLLGGSGPRLELPAAGAVTAAVADLHGDGFDDLLLGNEQDGVDPLLNSFVYFGSRDGLSERFHHRLPAPACTGSAIGDFDGDGRLELAMASRGKLRIFTRSDVGYEPLRHVDLPIAARDLFAADFDGDGVCDLMVLDPTGGLHICWGQRGRGLVQADALTLPDDLRVVLKQQTGNTYVEAAAVVTPLARAVRLGQQWWLAATLPTRVVLVEVTPQRQWGARLDLPCQRPIAVAAGDIDGDGEPDLVIAAHDQSTGRECSWVYWNRGGFTPQHRTALPSEQASDALVVDLDSDGCAEIVLCQFGSDTQFSVDSLLFRGRPGGLDPSPIALPTHGARRVLPIRLAGQAHPSLVFVNQFARERLGQLPATLYLGGPDGFSPQRRVEFPGLGAVNGIAADFNDDGRPDLLLVNCAENAIHLDPGCFVFLQGDKGFEREPSLRIPTRTAIGGAVADLNRDGYLDFIVQSYTQPELVIFHGKPGGFDTEHPVRIPLVDEGEPRTEGRRCLLADLNNDGWLDVVVTFNAGDRCYVLWGGPDGFDFNRRQTLSVVRPSCPVAVDLDGDGYLDLIIGGHKTLDGVPHTSFVYIYWNGPEGLREDRRTLLPADAVLGIAVADFNNDGKLDLYVSNYSGARQRDVDSFVYWADAKGHFSATRRTEVRNHSAAGCLAADFNNDGRVDLAVANHKTHGDHVGESYIYWNRANGMDWANPTRLPTRGPHGLMFTPPGNQADRGDVEHYLSEPRCLVAGIRPARITWQADLAPGTWVEAHVRCADSPDALPQAPWQGRPDCRPLQNGDALDHCGAAGARWWQYRLSLGARQSGGTPRIHRVEIESVVEA